MGWAVLIQVIPTNPELVGVKDKEEVRKALINLAGQVNRQHEEAVALYESLTVPVFYGTGSPPDPAGLPDGALFFKY